MYHESTPVWKLLLEQGLAEDHWALDWTARSLPGGDDLLTVDWIAKSPGVWAAQGLIAAVAQVMPRVAIRSFLENGQEHKADQRVAEIRGPARLTLALERTALNLAAYAGGVATATHKLVKIVRERSRGFEAPRVTLTRKTLPCYRDLAIESVIAGGGHPHRVNLAGGVLIKENHIAAAGGVAAAIEAARRVAPHSLRLEVEVRNLRELDEAQGAGAEIIMLDNFTPAQAREAVKKARGAIIEISGGLNAQNIGEYVMEGVHVLSVGSLTHSVQAVDYSWLARRSG